MTLTKHLYETTFIVNASLEDSQIESTIGHVVETITRNGGDLSVTNRWGRKRLAYPIQKKNNGFYVNVEFMAPGSLIPLLERVYQLDENILRFLTIQPGKKALKAREQTPVKTAAPQQPAGETSAAPKEPLFTDDVIEPVKP